MTATTDPAAKPSGIPLLDCLRQATHDAHRRLDARHILSAPHYTLQDYIAVLSAYRELHGRLETRLDPYAETITGLEWTQRRKLHLLERDLAYLSSRAQRPQLDDAQLPEIRSVPAALGCLYVMEGSTLGGRVLLKRVNAKLGLDVGRGATFLHAYGELTGEMWRRFTACLRSIDDASSRAVACAAARHTFAAFESRLAAYGALRIPETLDA